MGATTNHSWLPVYPEDITDIHAKSFCGALVIVYSLISNLRCKNEFGFHT